MNAKRNLALASVLLAVAAGAVWGSGRMSWMGVTVADGLSPERVSDVAGHTWAPALSALWLVFLAAIAAALALKNWARGVVAVIVAVAAVGAAYPALTVLTQEPDIAYLEKILRDTPAKDAAGTSMMGNKDYISQVDPTTAGPAVAIIGALLAVLAAALLMRGLRSGGMGSKYVSPAARRAELEQRVFDDSAAEPASERDLWDAMDGGEDPTESGGARPDAGEGAGTERPRAEG